MTQTKNGTLRNKECIGCLVKLGSNVLPKNKKGIAKIHNEQNVPSGFMDINESMFRQDLYTWVWFKMCFVKKWTPTFDGYWSSVMCAKCYLTFGRHTQIRLWCQVTLPCHVEPLSLLVSVLSPLLFVVITPDVTVVFHYVLVKTLVANIFTSRNPIICWIFVSYRHFVHDIPPFWLYVYIIYIIKYLSIIIRLSIPTT